MSGEFIAFPFTLRTDDSVVGAALITSTRETTHGLLRFGEDGLRVQWRSSRATQHVGDEIRTDREIDPVQEVNVAPSALAGAAVRWLWNRWPPGRYLVLTGADFRAFEGLAGISGLRLDHPAQLVVPIRRAQTLPAREFAVEIELALADRAIRRAEGLERHRVEGGPEPTVRPSTTPPALD
jgi:hypothetical protein